MTAATARAAGRAICLSLLLLPAGCNWPGKPDPAHRPKYPDQVTSFATLFGTHCAGCHGTDGKMGAAPPLNDDLFRAAVPAKVLEAILTSGRYGTQMPAFDEKNGGALTPAQIQLLVHEIKGEPYRILKVYNRDKGRDLFEVLADPKGEAPRWGVPAKLPEGVPPYLRTEGAAGAGDTARGQAVFGWACASCHGDSGEGGRTGDRKAGAINNSAFLSLVSDQFLRRIVITGRPDLGMPSYDRKDRKLTGKDVDDLGALLRSWRQGGAGSGK